MNDTNHLIGIMSRNAKLLGMVRKCPDRFRLSTESVNVVGRSCGRTYSIRI